MRVRRLRQALANLDEEATFISTDDPAASRIVVHALFAGDALQVIQAAGARRVVSTNSIETEEPRVRSAADLDLAAEP